MIPRPSYQHLALYSALPAILGGFLLYISVGYYLAAASVLPVGFEGLRLPLALLFVLLVFWAVRHTAASFYAAWSRGGGPHYYVALGWFLGLFILSGSGFLAASLFLFEGPGVVREAIDNSVHSLQRLYAAGQTEAPSDEYQNLRSRVTQEELYLHREITNPVICGVGDNAKKTIRDIQADLPGIQVLRDTDRPLNCGKPRDKQLAANIADQYDQMITAALDNPDLRKKYHIDEREEFLRDLTDSANENSVTSELNRLSALSQRMLTVSTFFLKVDLYDEALHELQSGQLVYSNFYSRLAALTGGKIDRNLPVRLDVSPVLDIASLPELPHSLWARRGYVETWLFTAFALLGDFLAAYSTYAALRVIGVRRVSIIQSWPLLVGTKVRYLWVNGGRAVGAATTRPPYIQAGEADGFE